MPKINDLRDTSNENIILKSGGMPKKFIKTVIEE